MWLKDERWRSFLNSPLFVIIAVAVIAIFLALVLFAASLIRGLPASTPPATPTAVAATSALAVEVATTPAATAQPSATSQPPLTATPSPSSSPSPLPTATPTETPLPTPTLLPTPTPTPTPVPLPVWRNIGELGIVEYTLTTEAEAQVEREGLMSIFGTDRVILEAVGRVKVGLDLTNLNNSQIERNGSAITLTLPSISVLSVEMLPDQSRIRTAERSWLYSEYEGLELEAMARARQQLAEMVANNESMMSLAQELAELRLKEHLRRLGFTDINIRFRSPSR